MILEFIDYSLFLKYRIKSIKMQYEMKNSGIEWLGMVPIHWTVRRGKNVLKLLSRPVKSSDEIVTCFRDGEVTLRKKRREEGFTNSLLEIGYQGIEPGDLVVHGMDGFVGAIEISDSRGKATPVLNVLDSKENKQFLMYYLRCLALRDVFMVLSTGIRVRSCDLRWNKLSELPYILPTIPEQEAIAAYLDEKCAAIDGIIAEAKATIDEYKSWKSSVIFEAVTKGLNPNAEMKDSGVGWIGKVPKDATVIKLKYLISDYKAGPFGSSLITGNLLPEGKILVYTPEHIAKKTTINNKNLFLPEERRDEMSQFLVKPGDIIFPIVGSLGRAMQISENMPYGIINQRLAKFRLNEKRVNNAYFMWLFANSSFYSSYIDLYQRGSIIVNLTKSIVGEMPFILYDLPTQCKISHH